MDKLTYEECVALKRAVRLALMQGAMDPIIADKLFEALHARVWNVNPSAIECGDYV